MTRSDLVSTIAQILEPWAWEIESWNATIARDDATAKAEQILAALALPAPVVEGDVETVAGRVGWHTSEEGGGPDVGISVGLGNGSALWVGELLDRDGGPVGIVFHGPKNFRYAAPFADMGEVQYLFEHHVAPAIAALSKGRTSAD